jgi:hypothetical protein
VFVVRDDIPPGFVFEKRVFQSQMLQVMLANSTSLMTAINSRNDGLFLAAIADGRHLCGDVLAVTFFKKQAKAALQKGPHRINDVQLKKNRALIASFCMKLCGEDTFAEKAVTAIGLVSMLQEDFIRSAGRWGMRPDHAVRTLREIDSALCDQLFETLQNAFSERDFSKLAEFAMRTMASRGGLSWETPPGKFLPC